MATLTQQHSKNISKIIDNILNQIFGEKATRIIYTYLEDKYSIKKEETGEKIELFLQGLREFLKSGAFPVERKILEE
ncbi:hypothetical protein H5T51_06745, partial [Candidatus Bathyarchaeota archaeon]|nr:hypothetical protein [Candidatus Bathyarchaeota archaeon]